VLHFTSELRRASRETVGLNNSRLAATGAEAPALIDFIRSPACPVSAKLTDDDRAKLQKIKQDAPKTPGG
jgi:hypothetical protein